MKTYLTAKSVLTSKANNIQQKEYSAFSFLTDYEAKEINSPLKKVNFQLELSSKVSTNGKVKFFNNDFSKVSNYNKKEVKNIHQLTHPTMPKTIFGFVKRDLENQKTALAIVKHIDNEGNAFWMNTQFTKNESANLNLALNTKAKATSKVTIAKVEKIYETLFLLEKYNDEGLASKYFNGLLDMLYGNYEGFMIDAFE